MTSNYKNIINEYTNLQFTKKSIEDVILEYSFLNMTDEELKEILDKAFQSLNNNYEKVHIQIEKLFEIYIREQLKDFNASIKLINDYINNKLDIYSSKYIKEINKLKDFIFYYDYSFGIDQCIDLLKSNKVLNDILGNLFELNKEKFLKENYNAINHDEFIITLIETYIDLNDINPPTQVDEKEEKSSKKGILTREEEIELVKKMQAGDKTARNKLIEKNTRLVKRIASRYVNRGIEFEDLYEEGIIGLITAVDCFDIEKGCKLSTYSTYWIKQTILRAIYDKGSTIRTPVHVYEKKIAYENAFNKIESETGRTPTNEQIMERTGLTISDIEKISNAQISIVSLNTKVSEDDNSTEVLDFIPDENQNVLQITEDKILKEELYDLLRETLGEREMRIIVRRYGLDGRSPETLEKIGEDLKLSRERIRQIQDKTLRKLKLNSKFKKFLIYVNGLSPSDLPTNLVESKKNKKELKKDSLIDTTRKISQDEIEENRAALIAKSEGIKLRITNNKDDNKGKSNKKNIYERYPEYSKEEIDQAIEYLDDIGLSYYEKFLKYLNNEYKFPKGATTNFFYSTFAKIEYNLVELFGNRFEGKTKLSLISDKYVEYFKNKKLNLNSEHCQEQQESVDIQQDNTNESPKEQLSELIDHKGESNMRQKKDIYERYSEYSKEEIDQALEWLDEKGHSYYELFIKYINDEYKLPKGATTNFFYSTFAKIEYNLVELFGNRFEGKTKLSLISDKYIEYFKNKKLNLNSEHCQEQQEPVDIQQDNTNESTKEQISESIDNIKEVRMKHKKDIYKRYSEYSKEEIDQAIEYLDYNGQYHYAEFLQYLKNEFELPKGATTSFFYSTFAKIEYNLIELFGNRFEGKTMAERISNTYAKYFKTRKLDLNSKTCQEQQESIDIQQDNTNESPTEQILESIDNKENVIFQPAEIKDSVEIPKVSESLPFANPDNVELLNDNQTLLNEKSNDGIQFSSNTEQNREENGVLNMLEINSFQQLMKIMHSPEAIVFALYSGYFRGHRFKIKDISDFLCTSEEETITMAKKASNLFKEKINEILDKEFNQNINNHVSNLNENNDNLYYLMQNLSNSEAIIVALFSGFFRGTSFNIAEISSFLNIEESETLNIIKKVMFSFKEKINNILNQENEEQQAILNKINKNY